MGTARGELEPKAQAPLPTFGSLLRGVLSRAGLLPYLFFGCVGGLAFGGAILVLPLVFGFAAWSLSFARVGLSERAVDPLPLFTLFGLGSAPYVAAELVDAALRHANLVAPAAPILAAAIAGWVALPLTSMPAHFAFRRETALSAIGRALAGADERRARYGTIPMALAGMVLGALVVAPRWLCDSDFNLFVAIEALSRRAPMGYAYWPVALAALPVMLVFPALSAALAQHDDVLLSRPVGGAARSPLQMTLPLFCAVGLALTALLFVPARASEPYGGAFEIHGHVPSTPPGLTVTLAGQGLADWQWELEGGRAFEVTSGRGTELVVGPLESRTAGIVAGFDGATGLLFHDVPSSPGERGSYVVSWLDAEGRRLDDSFAHRVYARFDRRSFGLLAALVLGALLLHRLRPGHLHRLTKPGRFTVRGTLDLDDDTLPVRRGARVVLLRGRGSVGTFRSDDGGVIMALTQATLLLGLPSLPDTGTKVVLVTPTRPASLALREGIAALPEGSAIVGDEQPVDTVLGTAMYRSAAIPLLVSSAIATVLCVRLVLSLS